VRGSLATLADGTIAGSVTNLMGCLRYAVRQAGVPLEVALTAATLTPAQAIGVDASYGSLAEGKIANIVLVDDNLQVRDVIIHGVRQ